jgi:hypothetical protein
MASAPSFDTQKMSTSANTDSMIISITIGIAMSRMARRGVRVVRSRREPRSASRTSDQKRSGGAGSAADGSDAGGVAAFDS